MSPFRYAVVWHRPPRAGRRRSALPRYYRDNGRDWTPVRDRATRLTLAEAKAVLAEWAGAGGPDSRIEIEMVEP